MTSFLYGFLPLLHRSISISSSILIKFRFIFSLISVVLVCLLYETESQDHDACASSMNIVLQNRHLG